MKFSKGDQVRMKHSGQEGVVVSYIDKKTVKVLVGNTKIPVLAEDLEYPYLQWFLDANKAKKEKKIYIEDIKRDSNFTKENHKENGIFLMFFPQYITDDFEEKISQMNVYLINETRHPYLFSYQILEDEKLHFDIENEIVPFSNFYIHNLSFEITAHSPRFHYSFVQKDDKSHFYRSNFILKPKKLYQYLENLKSENQPYFKILLVEKIEKKKEEVTPISLEVFSKSTSQISSIKIHSNAKHKVDLHIEKLSSRHQNLSSAEKLEIQLNEFEKQLDLAIALHQHSIVFIHGVGKGVLKNEIHKKLNQKIKLNIIKNYNNDYSTLHGFGATEVFIR